MELEPINDKFFAELLHGCGGFEVKLQQEEADSDNESEGDGISSKASSTTASITNDSTPSDGGGTASAADYLAEGLVAPPAAPPPKPTFRVRLLNLPYSAFSAEVRKCCGDCLRIEDPPPPPPPPSTLLPPPPLPISLPISPQVREFCSGCSHIEHVEIERAPDGRHAGTAIVVFGTEVGQICS